MKKYTLFIALVVALCAWELPARAEEHTLSLQQMFQLADQNNKKLQASQAAVQTSSSGVKTAKNAYLPDINLSLSVGYNGDATVMDRDFSHRTSAPIPSFGNNFALEVTQVIFAGGAIKNSVKLAKLQEQIAALNNEQDKHQIHFLIAGNYLELNKIQNQLQVFESHIRQTETMLDNMRQRYQQGVALQNDITRYELQLQNLRYSKIELENTRQILNDQLVSALGLPAQDTIRINSTDKPQGADLPKEHWHKTAQDASAVLQLADSAVKRQQILRKTAKAERYPQIALFAADHLDGPITIDIPAIDNNLNYWTAGIALRYNLGNFYQTGKKIKEADLALTQAQKEQASAKEDLRLAVEAAYIRYQEAFSLLATKKKSVELAQRNYNVVSYRYENGLVLITDLLDAAAQKLDAELQAVNAEINITYNFYKLQFVSGIL